MKLCKLLILFILFPFMVYSQDHSNRKIAGTYSSGWDASGKLWRDSSTVNIGDNVVGGFTLWARIDTSSGTSQGKLPFILLKTSPPEKIFDPPIRVPPMCDIKVSGNVESATGNAAANFEYYLEDL